MKINNLNAKQFAGITNKNIDFSDGLNIIVGDNESGKSTIAELLIRLLFEDVKPAVSSDFIKDYLPVLKNGTTLDFIEGSVVINSEKGEYQLHRKWRKSKEGDIELLTPDKHWITDKNQIDNILNEELGYGRGVFEQIVFQSQKTEQDAVKCILGTRKKYDSDTVDNLATTLKRASFESGGVSVDKMEKSIDDRITDLTKRWDTIKNCPEGGKNKKWSKGTGEIVDAYYKMVDAEAKHLEISGAEDKYSKISIQINEVKTEEEREKGILASFNKSRAALETRSQKQKEMENEKRALQEMHTYENTWPELKSKVEALNKLQKEYVNETFRNEYSQIKEKHDDYIEKKAALEKLIKVEERDYNDLDDYITEVEDIKRNLECSDFYSKVSMLGGNSIEIRAVSTGILIEPENGKYKITEAVEITIPGVMTMELTPGDVDVDSVKKEIENYNSKIDQIYQKYFVNSIDELKDKKDEYIYAAKEAERAKGSFEDSLGDNDWTEMTEKYNSLPKAQRTLDELEKTIKEICGSESIDSMLGSSGYQLEDLEKKYTSEENLRKLIEESNKKIEDLKNKIEKMESIPEEFSSITDFDSYAEELEKKINGFENNIESLRSNLDTAARDIGNESAEECLSDYEDKKKIFETKKHELEHWLKIKAAFDDMKSQIGGVSIDDIEENFQKYLNIVSGGRIELDSMDVKFGTRLSSGDNRLTYETLSEGTKDTISLAFRLAMLEHIFPNGNGIAVFDDPFADMSPARTKEACKLIQEFAKNNQVIFITCDDKYLKLMNADNTIMM